jgi:HlyD family secretion protein
MKKRLRIILPLLVIITGIFGYIFFHDKENGSTVIISGNIEVNEAQMSFRIPGRLDTRNVDEGDAVTTGQVLATLEKVDQEIATAKATATLALAQAQLAELEAGSRTQEVENARADLERSVAAEKTAEAQLNQAKDDFERYSALFKEGGISKKDYDLYNTRYIAAKNSRTEAQARIRSAREQLSLKEIGPRKETLDQAKAQVQVAIETLKQARQQEQYTELHAPMDGVVLSKAAEKGEYLNPASPVLTLGDLAHPWLRAYIHEKDLGRIALNSQANVTTDAFPKKIYKGRVSFISSQAEFTPKTVQTFEERAKLMYRIKIEIENPTGELKPGMPADATLELAKEDKQEGRR